MGDRVMDRNISPTGTGMAGMTSATKKERISSISLPCCFASSSVTLPTSQNTTNAYRTVIMLIGIACSLDIAYTSHPKFDPSTYMRLVLVPMDAQKGSIIYRLRAVDEEFDYPLTFELIGDTASATVMIESLPCTKYNSVCQANVVLQTRLEIGRFYDFEISVKDTNGNLVTQLCSITATNFTTPYDVIFPHKPGIIIVPEDAKRGTELDYVTARKNPLFQKPVYLELWVDAKNPHFPGKDATQKEEQHSKRLPKLATLATTKHFNQPNIDEQHQHHIGGEREESRHLNNL